MLFLDFLSFLALNECCWLVHVSELYSLQAQLFETLMKRKPPESGTFVCLFCCFCCFIYVFDDSREITCTQIRIYLLAGVFFFWVTSQERTTTTNSFSPADTLAVCNNLNVSTLADETLCALGFVFFVVRCQSHKLISIQNDNSFSAGSDF